MLTMMKNDRWPFLLTAVLAFSLWSCSVQDQETMTSGRLTMASSDDIFPVIDIQAGDFQRIYEQAHIRHLSLPAGEAVMHLLNNTDSVRLVVLPRQFNADELAFIAKNKVEIDSLKIAYDGIAVIVHAKNKLERLSTEDLSAMLNGTTTQWSALKGSGMSSTIVSAIGDPNGAVYEYLSAKFTGGKPIGGNVEPCSTVTDVFRAVKDHPNTIGFVSIAMLPRIPSDVKVLEIGDPAIHSGETLAEMEYFSPHPAYIYKKLYPLSRTIYCYTHNGGRGVALGFLSFAAGSDGQKIITSNGLVPATVPVRLVQLSTQNTTKEE